MIQVESEWHCGIAVLEEDKFCFVRAYMVDRNDVIALWGESFILHHFRFTLIAITLSGFCPRWTIRETLFAAAVHERGCEKEEYTEASTMMGTFLHNLPS
jgi:hypothetical protein